MFLPGREITSNHAEFLCKTNYLFKAGGEFMTHLGYASYDNILSIQPIKSGGTDFEYGYMFSYTTLKL